MKPILSQGKRKMCRALMKNLEAIVPRVLQRIRIVVGQLVRKSLLRRPRKLQINQAKPRKLVAITKSFIS